MLCAVNMEEVLNTVTLMHSDALNEYGGAGKWMKAADSRPTATGTEIPFALKARPHL
jgi:hypothetical protein